jgi:glycosyltransferase involved in cell wall biosynthesis
MHDAADTPLVSVAMATYVGDRLDFLQRAAESILGQTHVNLEFLIVANGPLPEQSRAWLQQRAESDPRVRVLTLPVNQGPGGARNAAFEQARGAFIAVMDADDVSHPDRLARQVAFLAAGHADVVGTAYRCIDDEGRVLREKQMPLTPEDVRRYALFLNPMANPTVMARADVLKKHRYRADYRYGEDYHLWITLLSEGYRLANLPDCLLDFSTGSGFAQRRRGWHHVRTDFANKFYALRLYHPLLRPLLLGLVPFLALARVLPAPILRTLYRLRNALHFD